MVSIIKSKKNWLIGLLFTLLALQTLSFIFEMIRLSQINADGVYYLRQIILTMVWLAFLAFSLISVINENDFWSKTAFILYFSYLAMTNVLGFVNHFIYMGNHSAISIFYGLGLFIDALIVISIAVIYLLNLSNKLKNQNVIDILILIRLIMVLINFIIAIVAIAQGLLHWSVFVVYLVDAVVTVLFYIGKSYNENLIRG